MSKPRAVGRKPKPENEHTEGYSPQQCVEGFAMRIRKEQERGSSILVTIGHDRLEAYATGIETFLADHDTREAQHLADMLHCQERVVNLLVALRAIVEEVEKAEFGRPIGRIGEIARVAIATEEVAPTALSAGVSMPGLNMLMTVIAAEEKESTE